MNLPKSNYEEFTQELYDALKENRQEFISRGLNPDQDISLFVQTWVNFCNEHQDDTLICDLFLRWRHLLGEEMLKSPIFKESHPLHVQIVYQGIVIGEGAFGIDIYRDVYGILTGFIKEAADNFIIPIHIINNYLTNQEPEGINSRDLLIKHLDYQTHRNWNIIKAKTHWVKLLFPKVYDKMMLDGAFLSLEEIEEKVKEQSCPPMD
jgi:hypothetical protein